MSPASLTALSISDGTYDVFISYCWSNSAEAAQKRGRQVDPSAGTESAAALTNVDPRAVATHLVSRGFRVWIDAWNLTSGAQSIWQTIAAALKASKLIVAFVSDNYAESENCTMELQFSLKSLRKPVLPVLCGSSNTWEVPLIKFMDGPFSLLY
jgi:hypothetical protein